MSSHDRDLHPQFSIIIPCRSISTYLREETIPAIVAQTVQDFELIILPDEEPDIHDELFDYSWIKCELSEKNSRPGIKRDKGVRISKGAISVFIDDDAWPQKDWLEKAATIFKKKNIVALGGPGMLPPLGTFWERLVDCVLTSGIGSGGYAFRFTPMHARYVDDFPSMNMMIRRDVFLSIGGFHTDYWPGEDSKLLNMLYFKTGKRLWYDPSVRVYHHRRSSIPGHIRQYTQYGFHRGRFFAHGDENSRKMNYTVPSLFSLYFVLMFAVICAQIAFRLLAPTLFFALCIPLTAYSLLIFYEGIRMFQNSRDIVSSCGVILMIPLTHVVYGFAFIHGVYEGFWDRIKISS